MQYTDLTPRQQSVLDVIISHQQEHGIAPTVREIAAQLGLSAPAGIHRILNILKERGYILADAYKKRAWRFAGQVPGRGIPLIGAIAAVELHGENLAISPALFGSEACFGLRVRGDSMIEAHIMDNDLAIIRPQQRVRSGQIAAVLVQDLLTEATLKIIRRSATTLTLAPANAAYTPLVFKGAERQRVAILGKLVGVVRRT